MSDVVKVRSTERFRSMLERCVGGPMLTTRFTELVGCAVPIQQAPMGQVSGPDLAVAVAQAGGLGMITALGMPVARLDAVLTGMGRRTAGAIGVNFLTQQVDRDAVALAGRTARVVDFFWSDPDPSLVALAHEGGALVSWQVGSLDEALAAVDSGCDFLIVQGVEAGGHVRGDASLLPLLSQVLEAVDVPVLAAGGIGDGRALAAVIAAGAHGARIGTRFVATTESGAHERYKQAVVDARAGATGISGAFHVCPLCATRPRARYLQSCIDAVERADGETVGEMTIDGSPMPVPKGFGMPPLATMTGEIEAMAMYCSDAAVTVTSVEPVAVVVERLGRDAAHLLQR